MMKKSKHPLRFAAGYVVYGNHDGCYILCMLQPG